MRNLMLKLWKDDCGALLSTEWIFVCVIIVLGSITGMVLMRNAVISELVEFGQAVEALNVGYSFSGQANCESSTGGSSANDSNDTLFNASFNGGDFDNDGEGFGWVSTNLDMEQGPSLVNFSVGAANTAFVDINPCD